MGIALTVWTTLGNIDVVTLSGPPPHGREVRFRLFILSLISSGRVVVSLRSFFVKVIPKFRIVFDAIINPEKFSHFLFGSFIVNV